MAPFPCFQCRHVFEGWVGPVRPCPRCGAQCVMLSPKFKAPPKNDVRQWRKVQFLVEHGFRFHSINLPTGTTARHPATLAEAKDFVKRFAAFATPLNGTPSRADGPPSQSRGRSVREPARRR